MPRRFIITAAVAVALTVLVGVGFLAWIGTGRGLVPVTADSPNASDIRDLYVFIGAFASAIFLVVTVPLAVFAIRFRSGGRRRDEDGPQIRGHTNLELAWTVVPVLILVVIAGFTFYKLSGIANAPAAGPAGDLKVDISGRQFYWQFTYPNGVVAINRLRVPAERVVNVDISAPDWDVIHSWWVPSLGGKRDAIPGRTNSTWFRANRTGTYEGRCAEFCGIQHAMMHATVEAMPAGEFSAWLSNEARAQQEGTSDLGRQTFEGVCAVCHGPQGEGLVGTALRGNPILNDRASITAIIRDGTTVRGQTMPPVGRDWSRAQLDATIEYLQKNVFPIQGGSGGG